MTWLAVISLKGRGERKTRLAGRLNMQERHLLTERMFDHVVDAVRACPAVSDIALLSDLRPRGWAGQFFMDRARGLNEELSSLVHAKRPGPLLVIHADLPLVTAEDISLLLVQAEQGCAIAPDRNGLGTNALALREPDGFGFAFGPGSFALHMAAANQHAHVVRRTGFGLDIDTPDDLDVAVALGFELGVITKS